MSFESWMDKTSKKEEEHARSEEDGIVEKKKSPNNAYKEINYTCTHCGRERTITLTQENKEQIDAYYEKEDAEEIIPRNLPFIEDQHSNPQKNIPKHTMHVEIDRQYTKRKDYVVHKIPKINP